MDISGIATPAWEEEGLKEKYQELLKKNLREAEKELRNMKHHRGRDTTDMNSINAVYDQLTKGIIKAAEQCLPRKKPPSLKGGLRVLSKQVWQPDKHWHISKKEKVASWQASKGASDSDSIGTTLRQNHRKACQALRIHTNKSRAKWLSNRLQKVSLFGDAHTAKHTWDQLKRSLGAEIMSGLPTQVRMASGKIVSGKEADDQWHKTRADISKFDATAPFNKEAQKRRSMKMASIDKEEQDKAQSAKHDRNDEGIMGAAIGREEVSSSLQRSSKGTAPGTDEVYNELLIQGGDYIQEILHLFFNVVWAQGHGPGEWDCALVRPLYKPKAKDPLLVENYRAVTLSAPSSIRCARYTRTSSVREWYIIWKQTEVCPQAKRAPDGSWDARKWSTP